MLPNIMENFLACLQGEKKNPKTIISYRKNLTCFLNNVFDGEEPSLDEYEKLTSDDFMSWLDDIRVRDDLSASTLNQRVATLSKFYTYLMGMKIVSVNTAHTIGVIKTDELFQRPVLTEDEVRLLVGKARELAESQSRYSGYRNELIVNIFLGTGLRIDELYKISVNDINIETGELRVVGKRGRKRTVFIPKSKLVMLEGYLKVRSLQKNSSDNALFLSRQLSENGYRLSINQIRRIVVDLAKQAKVKTITPHSLRHTGATLQIKNGADIMDVSKWLGHSSVSVTEKIYIHQTNESAQRVADVFDGIF